MKKLNKAGFTLIELLAVITLMGVLMMTAIPAVSRTIENGRRDTFADNALSYLDTVRNAVLADEIQCTTSGRVTYTAAALPASTGGASYYYKIDTDEQATKDLMEKLALSPWGGSRLVGYVKFTKKAVGDKITTTYEVCLNDKSSHGTGEPAVAEKDMSRSKIKVTGATGCELPASPTAGYTLCTLK